MVTKALHMPPETLWFVPFKLFLTDGTVYEIRHPESLMLGKRAAIIGLPSTADNPLFVKTVTLSLLHIVRVEALESAGTSNPENN